VLLLPCLGILPEKLLMQSIAKSNKIKDIYQSEDL